jgi:hypothetical protein
VLNQAPEKRLTNLDESWSAFPYVNGKLFAEPLPPEVATPAGLPQLIKGSQPTDGGHLILTEAEKFELISKEPQAGKWIRQYIGGEELINGTVTIGGRPNAVHLIILSTQF